MTKAFYIGTEIAEMISYIEDFAVFRLKGEKYATIAFMSEITLEEENVQP
jgi:hypothetical protein